MIQIHEIEMEGGVFIYGVHVSGTRMIEAGIDVLSRRNYL